MTRLIRALLAVGPLVGACASGPGAPAGAVSDCGVVELGGTTVNHVATYPRLKGQCFVAAVRNCHAARLVLHFRGVDTGTVEVLTVRRASHGSCVTSVAQTSSVLTRTTHRHLACRTVSVARDGVRLDDCDPPL